jgi:hypothetical protein
MPPHRASLVCTCCLLLPAVAGPVRAQQQTPTVAVLSPQADLVAAQTGDRVHVWERATGKLQASIKSAPMFRGAVVPGALIAVVDDGVIVRRGPGLKQTVRLKTPKVLSWGRAYLSADGRVAAVLYPNDGGVGDPDTLGIWDARSGARRGTIRFSRGRILGAALTRDGAMVALFGDAGRQRALLLVHRLAGKRATKQILSWSSAAHRTTYSAAWSADGRRLCLGAGTQLLLWELRGRRLRLAAQASTAAIKALFPPALRGAAVRMPGAHGLALSVDGKQLVSLHGMGVVGAARWRVTRRGLTPVAWIKRPRIGGTMRQLAFDAAGRPWLVSSTYAPKVWVHAPRGGRFAVVRVLAP